LSITHSIQPGIDASDIWMKKPAWSMLSVRGAVNTIGAPAYSPIRLPGSFFRPQATVVDDATKGKEQAGAGGIT
jgi:hypothetical protein